MIKIMLFIDGTWLYASTPKLGQTYGDHSYRVDFGKLPAVLAEEVGRQLNGPMDVVRTYLFGSFASNYDPRDEDVVARRRDFFDLLKEEYHYEVETFPIDFMGRRLRRADREPGDPFEPREKCVDIALASSLLSLAVIPQAYDVAIVVAGDRDFVPVLQSVRRLGKRVAVASIKGNCAPELADTRDAARVKDFDIIWLDDLLQRLELTFERHQIPCQSPTHAGPRLVWTTFHPRKGQKFFCDECRGVFSRQRGDEQPAEAPAEPATYAVDGGRAPETTLSGSLKKIFPDRQYGFIAATDGADYYFHATDLSGGLDFEALQDGQRVEFEVRRRPTPDRAGAAQSVRPPDAGAPVEAAEPDLEARPPDSAANPE